MATNKKTEFWEKALKVPFDLHVHSNFSDGEDSPRDIVLSAIDKGIKTIGFSDHSYVVCDAEWSLPEGENLEYKNAISDLKKEFAGKIDILCGIEQDYHTDEEPKGYDYIIGSVHHIIAGGKYVFMDETAQHLSDAADKYFGGDMISLCEAYYENVGKLYQKTGCDIVGHFDLLTKFNEQNALIDEENPRYVKAYQRAVDELIGDGCKLFEINYGAISRGYRTNPYPSTKIQDYIRQKGGRFICSSDSHSKNTVGFWLFSRKIH
jgi:histidinol-phosphatase (PHP family)